MRFSHKSRTLKYARCSKIASSLFFIKISRSLIKQTILRITVSESSLQTVTYASMYAPLLKRHCGGNNRPLVSFRGVKRRGNPLNRNENISGDCFSPHLFLQSLTAQAIRAISSSTDKNSSHSFAISLAWYMRLRRKWKNAICVLCTRANNCVRCDFLTSHVRSIAQTALRRQQSCREARHQTSHRTELWFEFLPISF